MTLNQSIHPEIQTILRNSPPLEIKSKSMLELRKAFDKRSKGLFGQQRQIVHVSEKKIETTQGTRNTRWYYPNDRPNKKTPTLVFFHGGGFVFGNLNTSDTFCQELAKTTLCTVIASDYPLAPENPFPAAPEACYALIEQLAKEENDAFPIFIAGSSAGGTLAAVTALMSRDRNGPKLAGQILLCPMISAAMNTASYKLCANDCGLTAEACAWFLEQYQSLSDDRKETYFMPDNADQLNDLPPALIITAEYDVLRDEAMAYSDRLTRAGIETKSLCAKGMTHVFYSFPLNKVLEKERAMAAMATFIKKYGMR
ncbi:MAG: Acetyl esterase [Chlamydiales bacterium]|nr:Acetyl esterase [Chlamydiales bacterium]MCH9619120.1 Acetyl esterase [Chlamydiales bacterium]MCH9622382.1 Acetyl esterase [Chlamydiales bacterium]